MNMLVGVSMWWSGAGNSMGATRKAGMGQPGDDLSAQGQGWYPGKGQCSSLTLCVECAAP